MDRVLEFVKRHHAIETDGEETIAAGEEGEEEEGILSSSLSGHLFDRIQL